MISTVEQNYSNVTCSESQHLMSNVSYYQTIGLSSNIFGFNIPQYYSYRWSYNLTVISCTFGLLRFLDVGPTRILENDGWRNYAGYGIAFISVFFSLYTKALCVVTGGYMMNTIIDQFNLCKFIMSQTIIIKSIRFLINLYKLTNIVLIYSGKIPMAQI